MLYELSKTNMNIEYFSPFGTLVDIKSPNASIFKGLTNTKNPEEYLKDTFVQILSGDHATVNQLFLNNTSYYVLSKGLDNFHKIVISAIVDVTLRFSKNIQQSLDVNKYSNQEFLNNYTSFVKNIIMFKKSLYLVADYFNTSNKKNLIYVYLNYLFYSNVINVKYATKDKEIYLYQLFLEYNDKPNISELFALFKIYNYYLGFSRSIKDDTNTYFNHNLEEIFINSTKSNSFEFMKYAMIEIDKNIKEIVNSKNASTSLSTEKLTQMIKKVTEYIRMCTNICDKTQFMALYLKYLQLRLLNKHNNFEIEYQFVRVFSYKYDPELFVKMEFCIDDMKQSNYVNKIVQTIGKITLENPIYLAANPNYMNNNICKYFVLNSYAWKESKFGRTEQSIIKEPAYSQFYVNLLNKILNHEDNKSFSRHFADRQLFFDYENSTVIFDVEMNNKTFTFNATFPQFMIYDAINEHANISVKELADLFDTTAKNLTVVLNSLMQSKLISVDPEMRLNINTSFADVDGQTNINLLSFIDLVKQKINENANKVAQTKQTQEATMQQENASRVRTKILEFFTEVKLAEVSSIKKYLNGNNLTVSDEMLGELLSRLISLNMLSKIDDVTYVYVELSSDDDNSFNDNSDDNDNHKLDETDNKLNETDNKLDENEHKLDENEHKLDVNEHKLDVNIIDTKPEVNDYKLDDNLEEMLKEKNMTHLSMYSLKQKLIKFFQTDPYVMNNNTYELKKYTFDDIKNMLMQYSNTNENILNTLNELIESNVIVYENNVYYLNDEESENDEPEEKQSLPPKKNLKIKTSSVKSHKSSYKA